MSWFVTLCFVLAALVLMLVAIASYEAARRRRRAVPPTSLEEWRERRASGEWDR